VMYVLQNKEKSTVPILRVVEMFFFVVCIVVRSRR